MYCALHCPAHVINLQSRRNVFLHFLEFQPLLRLRSQQIQLAAEFHWSLEFYTILELSLQMINLVSSAHIVIEAQCQLAITAN